MLRPGLPLLVLALTACAAPATLPPLRRDPSPAADAAALPDLEAATRRETLLPILLARSPRIAAARARLEAAAARVPMATALPDPMAEVTWFTRNAMDPDGRVRRYDLMIEQSFPFPTVLALRGDAAEAALRAEGFRYEAAVRDALADLAITEAERAHLADAASVQTALVAVYERLAAVARARPLRAAETLRAESLLVRARNEAMVVAEMRAVEDEALRAQLALPTGTRLGEPVGAPPAAADLDAAELTRRALAWNQELRAAGEEVHQRETGVRLARWDYAPMFTLGAGRMVNDEFDEATGRGSDSASVSLGITLPIWFGAKEAGVREAKAHLREAQAMESDARGRLAADVTRTAFRARNAERLAALYAGDLVPRAEAGLRRAETAVDDGTETAASTLELAAAWGELRIAASRARADHEIAVAELERLTGTSLRGAPAESRP